MWEEEGKRRREVGEGGTGRKTHVVDAVLSLSEAVHCPGEVMTIRTSPGSVQRERRVSASGGE